MFLAIAGEQLTDDPHLSSLVKALGGIPLAIDLVARRAHGRRGLAPIWREWQAIGTRLAKEPDTVDNPSTSLNSSIELSLRSRVVTRDPGALRLFALLGCLPSGIAPEDRELLLGRESFNAEECLVRSGLAYEQNGRIDLHPPLRDYARRYLPMNEDEADQWTNHYLALDRNLGCNGAINVRQSAEFANIWAAELVQEYLAIRRKRNLALADLEAVSKGVERLRFL